MSMTDGASITDAECFNSFVDVRGDVECWRKVTQRGIELEGLVDVAFTSWHLCHWVYYFIFYHKFIPPFYYQSQFRIYTTLVLCVSYLMCLILVYLFLTSRFNFNEYRLCTHNYVVSFHNCNSFIIWLWWLEVSTHQRPGLRGY